MLGTAGATMAASGAAAVGGVGASLFGYNRGNYAMDQKLHYQRFVAGHSLAIQQMSQYRQDIGDLTDLTTNRMTKFADLAGLIAMILTSLYCPGRLGINAPAPPGWLMGLFMVNLAGCYLWLGLTIWFAMHASLRANSAATHMLTRFVRIPVPSQKLLDRARKFLASYEEQPFREVFRIPFMRHQYLSSGESGFNEDMDLDADVERRTRHGHDVPAWYKQEKASDGIYTFESMMPYHARGTAPEHFEAYREIQNEWWPYDVYSRICIFLAFLHLTHAWTYHQIGHHMAETRSVFAAGCVVLPVSVLQHIILAMDLLPVPGELALQHIGPFAQLFAYVAAAIEYRPYYDQGIAAGGYVLVYVAYGIHIIFTLQMLRLCSPDFTKAPEPAEAPGAAWWPSSWRLPSRFAHTVFLVAPPRHLETGQTDLVGEMRNASRGNAKLTGQGWNGTTLDPRDEKRRDVHRALGRHNESPAWISVKWGLVTMILAWIVLIIGFSIEVGNSGTLKPSLLSAPGLPGNSRDPRYRPAKPWYATAPEVGTGGVSAGPFAADNLVSPIQNRRLVERLDAASNNLALSAASSTEIADRLRDLIPYLDHLASGKSATGREKASMGTVPAGASAVVSQAARAAVRWPSMFQPRTLACGHASAADAGHVAVVLSHFGRGAVVTRLEETLPFSLEGTAGFGHLVAAHWDETGMLLASSSGTTLECPGSPAAGRWRCSPINGATLPISSAGQLFHGIAALARLADGSLVAAVVFPGETSVMLFSRAVVHGAPWRLMGEVRTHAMAASAAFADNGAALLLSSSDGAVARMSMVDGRMVFVASAVEGHSSYEWQATCSLASGGLARLASADFETQGPVLFLG